MVYLSCVKSFFRGVFAGLLGGGRCVCCGEFTFHVPLCIRCREKKLLDWIPSKDKDGRRIRCSVCGTELVSEIDICTRCRSSPLLSHTDGVVPVHPYRFWKKDLLFMWKTEGMRQLSPLLARLASKVMACEFCANGKLPLVPVPPRPGKLRRVGWDQVDELCRYLSAWHGFRVLRVLERTSVVQQKKLDRRGRLDALGTAYVLKKDAFLDDIPEAVVLVDDIMTTGVTIETCARCLKEGGVKTVYAFTLFSVT